MKKKDGISLAIALKEIDGLAQVGKDFLSKISQTNFNFDVYDTSINIVEDNKEIEKITCNQSQFKKRIFFNTIERKPPRGYHNIKNIFWEFESGMLEFRPKIFRRVNEVVVFTDFIYNYLTKIAPKNIKITKIKYPFVKNWDITFSKEEIRKKYNINNDDFVCFFNFDYRSAYNRKNPEMTIKAFAESIGHNSDAKIIIKTSGFNDFKEQVKKIETFTKELGIQDKVIFINTYLDRNEVMSIIDASDCYISLHRGEGLGLGMLEAMAMAKPVIATNYSGNTEFTRESNSLLVDYELVDVNDDFNAYQWVEKWAEPNIETAKKHLLKLYSDRDFAIALGQKADAFIKSYYDLASFKKDIESAFKIKEGKNKAKCLNQKRKKNYILKWFFINVVKKSFNSIKSQLKRTK